MIKSADHHRGCPPPWTPGAHVDLVLADGTTRQYSLCGDPTDRTLYRLAVLREEDGRGGSRLIHDELEVGSTVGVRGSRNHFPLVPSSDYLFIAGGIGITPLLPMIATAAEAGADWQLYYGGRERAAMAFLDELARYGDRVAVVPEDDQGMLDLDSILRSWAGLAEDAGLPVSYSCSEGTCGTCETSVLEGLPDHRDAVLTDAEREANDRMMICVSRCLGSG